MLFGKGKENLWLAVFLGNPGKRFEESRHNVGFMTADLMCAKKRLKINKLKFKSLYCKAELGGENVIFLKPQTYMNLSGEAVREAAAYFKIPVERTVVVFDDVSLPVGKLRIRKSGSAGGHNGIKSIIAACGSDDFPRVKIGVGSPPHPDYDMADWVLGGFSASESKKIAETITHAAGALEAILSRGIDAAMNEYN